MNSLFQLGSGIVLINHSGLNFQQNWDRDNLHEISNPVFYEKQEKYHQFVVWWINLESGKG